MVIQDYFEALVGQFLEVAGTDAKNQCVDSVNFYIKWVLRLPPIEWTNAVDFPEKASRDLYDWIENTDTNKPIEGDIIVWKGSVGHIAVCFDNDATVNKFKSYDQNWPSYSPCIVVEHTYANVRGWLRPKNIPQSAEIELQKCILDRNAHWDFIIKISNKLGIDTNETLIIAEIDKLVGYEDKVIKYESQLNEVNKKATELETKLAEKVKQLKEESTQIATLTVEVGDSQKKIKTLSDDYELAITSLQELKNQCGQQQYKGFKKWIFDTFLKV
jgi:uncharacterized coiled-coil protein SlyX